MMFRRTQTVFSDFLEAFVDYCSIEAFSYVIEQDYDFVVENINYVDINNPGIYFVKEDISLYDETKTLIKTLDVYSKTKDYFIDEFSNVRLINDKYNNTLIGQYGITINIGDNYNESTYSAPEFYFMFINSTGNPLEINYNTDRKVLSYNIGVVVDQDNLWDRNSNYTVLDFYVEYCNELLWKFFNQCPRNYDINNRLLDFFDCGYSVIEEKSPLMRGLISLNQYFI